MISQFHLEDGSWALVDISDRRLGHPLKVLRALCEASPKTAYPWPQSTQPLGCERAAVLLLMGYVPYPNTPPFHALVAEKMKMVFVCTKRSIFLFQNLRKIRDLCQNRLERWESIRCWQFTNDSNVCCGDAWLCRAKRQICTTATGLYAQCNAVRICWALQQAAI